MNFYEYISQVAILGKAIENLHPPKSSSHAPPLSITISQSGFYQHKFNLPVL